MSNIKVTKCKGEGQGSCKMCSDNGKWNRNWMCFLYEIEGYDGCYCSDCVEKIISSEMKKVVVYPVSSMTLQQRVNMLYSNKKL